MMSEGFIEVFSDSDREKEDPGFDDSNSRENEVRFGPSTSHVDDESADNNKITETLLSGPRSEEYDLDVDVDDGLIPSKKIIGENVDLVTCASIEEEVNGTSSNSIAAEEKVNICDSEKGNSNVPPSIDSSSLNHDMDYENSKLGVKRARTESIDIQPSVRVVFNSLTRDSRRKLNELMNQWSEWHTRYTTPSNDLSQDPLEHGEKTYFPAIHVSMETSSVVRFWMDNHVSQEQTNNFIALDNDSAPLYDRGYGRLSSLDGSSQPNRVEDLEASRCFNCGSYSHSLKECPKPHDNAAVNKARKEHNSKRSQTISRLPSRYYQNSPCGKYEGLKPGTLCAETRQCLGIGELDPPPWLNRMRQIGYPPGYLEVEDEPSGITIYADEETEGNSEEGEILPTIGKEIKEKKMTVEFPGINAPLPENADLRLWQAPSGLPGHASNRRQSHSRDNHTSERGHYHNQSRFHDYQDIGPSNTEHGVSPLVSSYMHRYSGYESPSPRGNNPIPRGNNPIPRGLNLGRAFSDRGSPQVSESLYHQNLPSPLCHSNQNSARHSPQNYHPSSFDSWTPENQRSSESSERREERHSHHLQHHRHRHHHHQRN